jgi:hypothetical protein
MGSLGSESNCIILHDFQGIHLVICSWDCVRCFLRYLEWEWVSWDWTRPWWLYAKDGAER